jgi:hypothetical protein
LRLIALAKIDDVIDRLERLNSDVLSLKRSLIPLLPLPPVAKPLVRRTAEGLDPIIAELYFDALRGGVDLARDPRVQEESLKAIQSATRPRSRAQKRNDKMQSTAFKMANSKLRTKTGALRKGVTQSDVAKRAQKELKLMKRGTRPARKSPSGGTKKRKSPPRRSGGGKR